MCFAELIIIERKDLGLSSDEYISHVKQFTQNNIGDSEMVINSAITLCGVAAKKVSLYLFLFLFIFYFINYIFIDNDLNLL